MQIKNRGLIYSFLGVFLLSACGGEENADSESEEQDQSSDADQIELRVAWWGGQERHDQTLEMIELYEEKNPDVTIEAEYSGFDGYFDQLSTQFAAGNAPDIIQYGGNLNDFVSRDVVLPLDDYVGEELDLSNHDEAMVEAGTFDDQFYGVTLGTNAWGVLINETLFEEANVSLPGEEWTWDDFDQTAAELTEALDGVYGTEYFDHNGFGIFVDQRGKILHEDGELGINQEDVEAWFSHWEAIRDHGGVVLPEIQAASSTTPEQSMIVQGDVAMQLIPSNLYGAHNNATEDDLAFHIHPYNEEGRHGVSLRPSQFMAGYSKTEHPQEVAEFLDFMVNDPEATEILGSNRGVPVNAEVRANLIESASEEDKVMYEYVDWVSSTSDSPYVPNLPGYNETEALFQEMSESIAFDQISIEEGAAEYWQSLQEIVENNTED
ncbi:ABC transporter substrate-binding protein [Salibacterium aidingense]|uniref:ABC transporter substrate-binding protein n=1 Tax=Salibacterium aidingense TaxID=384933 RepID=UPI003BC1294D